MSNEERVICIREKISRGAKEGYPFTAKDAEKRTHFGGKRKEGSSVGANRRKSSKGVGGASEAGGVTLGGKKRGRARGG